MRYVKILLNITSYHVYHSRIHLYRFLNSIIFKHFSSDPISTGHLSSPIQAVVEILCIILWITIHEICLSHLMFSPGLYWPGEGMYTFSYSNDISVYTLQIQ